MCVIALLLLLTKRSAAPVKKVKTSTGGSSKVCPLCGSALQKGETIRTVIYPGKNDTIAEVYGCPHCSGVTATEIRICLVCKNALPKDGFVIGRMFKQQRHLHVLGCTECRKRKTDYRSTSQTGSLDM